MQTAPNHLSIVKRIRFHRRGSVHNQIESFFTPSKAESGSFVGTHCQEYTKYKLCEITHRVDFECKESVFFKAIPNLKRAELAKSP